MKRALLLVLCPLALWACDRDPVADAPLHTIRISLSTPHQQESALLLRLTGPGISNVRAVSGAHVLAVHEDGDGAVRVILLGDITPGPLLLFDLTDLDKLPDYLVEPLQVASPSFALRDDVQDYDFSIAPE